MRRARGENGISLPPEGFPHSFHTPPELASELDASSGVLPYALSARLLRHFGIAIDHEELAVSLEEGMAAAGRIGYPVALKAASPDIAHKTETGLVKLNLRTRRGIRGGMARA